MAFTYFPIPLFNEEHFQQCIVVPFPEGGKIVDTMVVDKTAYILVEARTNAKASSAHFHIVPLLQPLYADAHEYVGTYKIENFQDRPLVMYSVIRITEGDYGMYSEEFLAIHGQPENDKIVSESNLEVPDKIHDEDSLRKTWDFGITWGDKTNDDENTEPESESE